MLRGRFPFLTCSATAIAGHPAKERRPLEARPTNTSILAIIGLIVKAILAYSSRPIGLPNLEGQFDVGADFLHRRIA